MLRHAARRVLWILPTLVGFSLTFFWLLTSLGLRPHDDASLPRFLNFAPADLGTRAPALALSIAKLDDRGAAVELARLGGAALPHILPVWDTWTPEERARVAQALVPVLLRMGALQDRGVDGAAAVLHFNRFWQDYSAEFKPVATVRLVDRVARRPQATRTREILRLDTFALPALIARMGPVRTDADVASVRRLAEFASRSSGHRLLLPGDASVAAAEQVARLWRRWWTVHRADYTTLSGPMRLAATVTETQYGRWVASLLGSGLGETKDGRPVLHAILAPLQVSMTLLAVALGAGYGLAFLFIRFNRNRRPRRRPGYRRATLIALAVIVSIPGGGAYVFSSVAGEDGEALTTPTVAGLLASTLIAALTILSTLARRGSPASGLVHVSKLYERATNEQQRFRPTLAPLAGDAALVLLALLVTEGLTRLEGLARLTKSAATTGDFSLLMALGLTGTLTALILGLVSDAALGAPRRLSGLLGEERH